MMIKTANISSQGRKIRKNEKERGIFMNFVPILQKGKVVLLPVGEYNQARKLEQLPMLLKACLSFVFGLARKVAVITSIASTFVLGMVGVVSCLLSLKGKGKEVVCANSLAMELPVEETEEPSHASITEGKLRTNVFKGLKECVKCGNKFTPNSNRQKYCPDCRQKVEREKNREYVKRWKAKKKAAKG